MSDAVIRNPHAALAAAPSTLVEFILGRLDEDEQVAQAAEADRWEAPGGGSVYEVDTNNPIAIGPWGSELAETADHIARHDPARVLVDVAAKRAIVELHGLHPNCHPDIDSPEFWICAVCHDYQRHDAERWPCPTLRLLALSYAEHESYREDWKP